MPPETKRLLATAASASAVGIIGWIDYITGPEIGLSLLYLVAIAASGWLGGVWHAAGVATIAAIAWLLADIGARGDGTLAISFWNAFTRLVIYTSEGVFIALLRRDREALRAQALTDHTTHLPNMRGFLKLAERKLRRARESNEPLALIYIDLDNFKIINDRLGHAAGDDILEESARILRESLHNGDVAGRLGGDEFAVLLTHAGEAQACEIAEEIARRIRAIGAPYPDIRFGATAGVAYFSHLPASVDDLVRAADDAMYAGKASGKGRVHFQNL